MDLECCRVKNAVSLVGPFLRNRGAPPWLSLHGANPQFRNVLFLPWHNGSCSACSACSAAMPTCRQNMPAHPPPLRKARDGNGMEASSTNLIPRTEHINNAQLACACLCTQLWRRDDMYVGGRSGQRWFTRLHHQTFIAKTTGLRAAEIRKAERGLGDRSNRPKPP